MRGYAVLFCVFAAVASIQVNAQEISSTLLFPVVARTEGAGDSRWVSDLVVNNLLGETVTVGLQFFPENQTNSLDFEFPDRFQLAPRETRLVEDILASFFGYDTNIKGVLLVTVDPGLISGNSEEANIAGVTRTYNVADPAGTYGQSVPGLDVLVMTTDPLVAAGARNDDSYRSNLGIVNIGFFDEALVHFRILGSDGSVLVEGTRTVRALSMRQWSFQQLGVGSVEGPMTVELWLDEGSAADDPCDFGVPAIMGYVSKVDNGTDDGEFIYAFPTVGDRCD
ncbi:MAG: hypothetical protein KAJ78_05365 [Acidobacteria bacterium]|nr:hypothetical protein [Acidobacteriota bacterium]